MSTFNFLTLNFKFLNSCIDFKFFFRVLFSVYLIIKLSRLNNEGRKILGSNQLESPEEIANRLRIPVTLYNKYKTN